MELKIIELQNEHKIIKKLLIDGVINDEIKINSENETYLTDKGYNQIREIKLKDLEIFGIINFRIKEPWSEWNFWNTFYLNSIQFDVPDEIKLPYLAINPSIAYREWNKGYTVIQLQKSLKEIVINFPDIAFVEGNDFILDNFSIVFPVKNKDLTLNQFVAECFLVYKQIQEQALEDLNNYNSDILSTFFEFPEELKTSCKQYLIYFGQFLADLGINADTSLKEQANKILFTVSPKDGLEAIEKIKEALHIFINAPAAAGFEGSEIDSNDVAIMQWQSNILHLKSQVALARALLQTKDATIEVLKLSNYQLEERINNIQIKHSQNTSREEPIIGNILSVKKYEGKGFSLDLAEIARRLKRSLKF